MMEALFQRLPRGLFEPIAVLGLIGMILFLCRHWKKDRGETILFGSTLFFMLLWRLLMPINSDRYVLLLIPAAIFFSIYAIEEFSAFCRKRGRFPDFQLFLGILLIACAVKSFHNPAEDPQLFVMMNTLKADAGSAPKVRVVSNLDLSYFLGDRFDVRCVSLRGPFQPAALPEAEYCLLRLRGKQQGVEWKDAEFSELKRMKKAGGKSVFVLWKRKKCR